VADEVAPQPPAKAEQTASPTGAEPVAAETADVTSVDPGPTAAEPAAEEPAAEEPAGEKSPEPAVVTPAEPVAEKPAGPVAEEPAEPADPVGGKTAEKAAEPAVEKSAGPVAEEPAEPVGAKTAEKPAESVAEKTGEKTGEPTEALPAAEALPANEASPETKAETEAETGGPAHPDTEAAPDEPTHANPEPPTEPEPAAATGDAATKKRRPAAVLAGWAVLGLVVLAIVSTVIAIAVGRGGSVKSLHAKPGDCLSGQSDSDLKRVSCTDSKVAWTVVGVVQNKTENEAKQQACAAWPQAEASYWESGNGKTGFVLCLATAAGR
jgi:hypothetical protein